ncbi:hypothetical protein SAMN05421787_104106 [Virgibacillus pantothenticus]|nr:hypothetical protein SAMN05421787_104106 [Virgibacillus pantothenticus]
MTLYQILMKPLRKNNILPAACAQPPRKRSSLFLRALPTVLSHGRKTTSAKHRTKKMCCSFSRSLRAFPLLAKLFYSNCRVRTRCSIFQKKDWYTKLDDSLKYKDLPDLTNLLATLMILVRIVCICIFFCSSGKQSVRNQFVKLYANRFSIILACSFQKNGCSYGQNKNHF